MYRISLFFFAISKIVVFGYPVSRIFGGIDAPSSFAPYQVIITLRDTHQCSGAIIHQHAILTAAQCFIGESPSWFKIISGTHYLNKDGNTYPLHYYVLHPQYDRNTLKNDVAVGILNDSIQLGPRVTPITLSSLVVKGDVPLVTGIAQPYSEGMKMAFLKTVDNRRCLDMWNGISVSIAASEICTLPNIGEGMCYGDAGNPLVYNNTLIGLGSWGVPCGMGYPDVYQRTSYYISWIYQTLQDSPFTRQPTTTTFQ